MKRRQRISKFLTLLLLVFLVIGFTISTPYAKTPSRMEIYQAQKRLKELGYMSGFISMSGLWGQKTSRAVRKFQKDNGLAVTGKLDEKTIAKLVISKEVISHVVPTPAQPDRSTRNNWHQQAKSHNDIDYYDEAIPVFAKEIELGPNDTLPANNRGITQHKTNKHEKSVADLMEAIVMDPEADFSYNRRIHGWDEEDLNDITIAGTLGGQFYHDRGMSWYKKGEYDRAIADFAKALEIDPKEIGFYRSRGSALRKKGEYSKALSDFSKAIEIDSNNDLAYHDRGATWHQMGEYDRAIADFTKAVVIDSRNALYYYDRGASRYNKGEYDRAIEDFTHALEIDSQDAASYRSRGAAWHQKGEYDEAIADFSKALEIDPKDDRSYFDRGLAWYKKGGFDQSISDLSAVIELDPKSTGAYQIRGAAWNKKEEYNKAITDLTKAIAIDPKEAVLHNNRGLAWYYKGDYKRAISDFTRAIELDPENNTARFNLEIARETYID